MVDFWGRVLQNNPNVIDRKSDHVIGNNALTFKSTANGGHAKNTKPANLFRSVLNSSNDFFSGLHTKLNAALSLDDNGLEEEQLGDSESDSLYDGYMKKKQRDSGGEFGESSTTSPSWDMGFTGAGGSTSGARDKISSRYPKRWMDPTVIMAKQHHKSKTSSSSSNGACTGVRSTTTDKSCTKEEPSSAANNKHRLRKVRKSNGQKSTSCCNDSDPISSNESGSESENPTTDTVTRDIDSSSLGHSTSEASLLSWSSNLSHESQNDEGNNEIAEYMRHFVDKLLNNNVGITQEEKAHFGQLCQTETGRLWFARCINAQRMNKKVKESTFYSLIQYFAICIFECSVADDYSPAKSLMNMCFTFYHEVAVPGCKPYKEFLYLHLKEQPIWQSLRFWNAAFFDAVQCERAHRPVATRKDMEHYSPDDISDEKELQENITFGQLGSFTCNMHAFGLSKELCLEFLRKQSTIADLKPGQIASIRENIEKMFSETEPWRS